MVCPAYAARQGEHLDPTGWKEVVRKLLVIMVLYQRLQYPLLSVLLKDVHIT